MTAKTAKASKKAAPKTARKPVAKKQMGKTAKKKTRTAAAKPKKATRPAPSGKPGVKRAVRKPKRRASAKTARPARKPLAKKWWPFRDALVERQRELTQAYNTSKGDSRSRFDDGTEDYIDYAVSSYAREFLLSLTEMDRKQLMLVEEALRRLQTGEYGRCLNCGENIAPKRLQVAPWVRFCVRCQELDEQGLLTDVDVGGGDEDELDADEFDIFDEDAGFQDEEEDEDEDEEELGGETEADDEVSDAPAGALDLDDDEKD